MPRKITTEEQRENIKQLRRENHHNRIDYINKLAELLLDGREKTMEINDVLAAVREKILTLRPGLRNKENENGYHFRRTVEFDGVRESICASSNMGKNRVKWEERRRVKENALERKRSHEKMMSEKMTVDPNDETAERLQTPRPMLTSVMTGSMTQIPVAQKQMSSMLHPVKLVAEPKRVRKNWNTSSRPVHEASEPVEEKPMIAELLYLRSPSTQPFSIASIAIKSSLVHEAFEPIEKKPTIAEQLFLTPRESGSTNLNLMLVQKPPRRTAVMQSLIAGEIKPQPQPQPQLLQPTTAVAAAQPELNGPNLVSKQESGLIAAEPFNQVPLVQEPMLTMLTPVNLDMVTERIKEFPEWHEHGEFNGQPNVSKTRNIIGGQDKLTSGKNEIEDIEKAVKESRRHYEQMPEFNINTFNAFYN